MEKLHERACSRSLRNTAPPHSESRDYASRPSVPASRKPGRGVTHAPSLMMCYKIPENLLREKSKLVNGVTRR